MSDDLRGHLHDIARDRPAAVAVRARLARRRRTPPVVLAAASVAVVMVVALGVWWIASAVRPGPPASGPDPTGTPVTVTSGVVETGPTGSVSGEPAAPDPVSSSADPAVETPSTPDPSTAALPAGTKTAVCFRDPASARAGVDAGENVRSYDFTAQAGQAPAAHSLEQLLEACRVAVADRPDWPDASAYSGVGCLTSDGQVFVVPAADTDRSRVCGELGLEWIPDGPPRMLGVVPSRQPALSTPSSAVLPFATWSATCYGDTDRTPERSIEFSFGDYAGSPERDYPTVANLVDACRQTLVREQWAPEDTGTAACLAPDGWVEVYPVAPTASDELVCEGLGMPVIR